MPLFAISYLKKQDVDFKRIRRWKLAKSPLITSANLLKRVLIIQQFIKKQNIYFHVYLSKSSRIGLLRKIQQ